MAAFEDQAGGGFGLRLFKSSDEAYKKDVAPRAQALAADDPYAAFAGEAGGGFDASDPYSAFGDTGPAQTKAPEQGNFRRGLSVSGKQLRQTAYGTAALIGDTFGSDTMKDWGLKGYQEAEKEIQAISKESDSFTSALEKGELGKWFSYSSGYLLGQFGELAAASAAGAVAGSALAPGAGTAAGAITGAVNKAAVQTGMRSMVGKMIDKQVAANVARGMADDVAAAAAVKSVYGRIGAATANTFLNATQELGSIYGEAVEEAAKKGEEYSLGRVWLAGVAATAVDSWADSKAVGKVLDAFGGDKAIKGVAMEALKGGFRESMTEGVQTAIERWGANKDLTTKEAFKDYIDSAAVGFLGGGVSGGVAGGLNKLTAPSEAKPVDDKSDVGGLDPERNVNDYRQRQKSLPEELRGLPQEQVLEALQNPDALAFLYDAADPARKKDIELAAQRAGLIDTLDQVRGRIQNIEAGKDLLSSDPVTVEKLFDGISSYANTQPQRGPVKMPARQPVVAPSQFDQQDAEALAANAPPAPAPQVPPIVQTKPMGAANAVPEAPADVQTGIPNLPPVNTEVQQAKENLKDSAANLFDALADVTGARKNIGGQQYTVKDLPPAISRVMQDLARLGYVKFKDVVSELMARMRASKNWSGLADQVTPQMLRDAYNGLNIEGREDASAIPDDEIAPLFGVKTSAPAGIKLTGTSSYLAKDQRKADRATKFIGRGSEASSTARYAQDFGALANSGTYYADDVVFVSAEGNRGGRVDPDFAEIGEAMKAGATILTDDAANRNRPYNVGERQVAEYLANNGYSEAKPGEWKPSRAKVNLEPQPLGASDTQSPSMTGNPGENIPEDGPGPAYFLPQAKPAKRAETAKAKEDKPDTSRAKWRAMPGREAAAEEEKEEVQKAPAKKQSPYLQQLTLRGEIKERLKTVPDVAVTRNVNELLNKSKLDEAEKALDDYFKKAATPAKGQVEGARRRGEMITQIKADFDVSDGAAFKTSQAEGAPRKTVSLMINDLLTGEPTKNNIETAERLIDFESTRVVRELLKRGMIDEAQLVFDQMGLGPAGVKAAQTRFMRGESAGTLAADMPEGKGAKRKPAVLLPYEILEQLPNLKRYVESIKGKDSLPEPWSSGEEGTTKEVQQYRRATLIDLGAMSMYQLKQLDKMWGKLFALEAKQMPLDLGKAETVTMTARQNRLIQRAENLIKRTSGSTMLKEGIDNLRAQIAKLDEQIADENFTGEAQNYDALAGLFGFFDENAYDRTEGGFIPDRAQTTKQMLVQRRAQLQRELNDVIAEGAKGKAARLKAGIDNLKQKMLELGQTAVDTGMTFQDVYQALGQYAQYVSFADPFRDADRKVKVEKNRLVDEGYTPKEAEQLAEQRYGWMRGIKESLDDASSRDIAEAATADMFPEGEVVERLAAGEITPVEAFREAGALDEATVLRDTMYALVRQIADPKLLRAERDDRLQKLATWIGQNMRERALKFSDVRDAFQKNGLDMPIQLIGNSILARHTRMLDYTAQMGGGYAPREFWLRSMDRTVDGNVNVALTSGWFTDAELEMYQEWKERQEELLNRRAPVRILGGETAQEAFGGMLFMKHGLAQMRNPRLIANERERLTLTNNISDLVGAWHRDLQLALQMRPDLRRALFDSDDGIVLPGDYLAHRQWVRQQDRAAERKAEIIEKSKYYTALPQFEGLSPEELDRIKLDIIKSDLASVDQVFQTAVEMDKATRAGQQTVVDPETGEIIFLAEKLRADFVDQMLEQDQSTASLEEQFGTSDKRVLNKVRRAMDEGTSDVTDKAASFARVASEGMRTETQREFDVNDFEAIQSSVENQASIQTSLESQEEGDSVMAERAAEEADPESSQRDQDASRFKRGFFSGNLTNAVVQAHVSRITEKWKNAPQIIVLKNVAQLPDGVRERVMEKLEGEMDAKGLFDGDTGMVYLFSDNLTSEADVEFTLFHEVDGHLGLRAFFGAKFDGFLENMYRIYPDVRKQADELIKAGMPKLEAIDEVMSDMAGAESQKPSGAVKQWVGKIIAGLREIGLTRVADWFAGLTNAERSFYLKQARDAARDGDNVGGVFSGAPGVIRLRDVKDDRTYEMFSTREGKTTGYARFNPITQTWSVFTARADDIRNGYAAMTTKEYSQVLQMMKARGKTEFRKRSGLFIDDKLPGDMPKITEITNLTGVKRWMRSLITKFQNEYRPVFDVVEALRAMGRIGEGMDVKTALMLYERKVGSRIARFRKVYADPIYQLVQKAGGEGAQQADIEEFLLARHAEERNKAIAKINDKYPDGGSGMTNAEAAQILADVQTKPYYNTLLEIGRKFDQMSKAKLKYQYKTGMITAAAFMRMSQYKHYVNLSGQDVELKLDQYEDPSILAGGSKFNVKGKEKRALGRSSKASDIMAHTILGMESAIIRGQKNMVAQTLLAMLEANYDPNFATVNEIAYTRQIGEDGMVMEVEDQNYIKSKDVMVAKVNGIPVTIKFKDTTPGSFADAIHGAVYPESPGDVMAIIGKMNRILGQMLTTWNPAWVAVNFVRDTQNLYFNAAADGRITKAQAAQMVRTLPKAITVALHVASNGKYFNNADPDLIRAYREMEKNGGLTSFMNRNDLEKQVGEIHKLLGDRTRPEKAWDKLQGILDKMEYLTLPMEIAPRLAAYKVVRDNGFSIEESAKFSGEITVNFNMRGSNKATRQLFLFFNPAVQGSAKILSLFGNITPDYKIQLRAKGFGYAAAFVGVGALANLLGRAFSDDDEAGVNALDKVPTYKRATSIVVSAGDQGFSIPIPYGWNAFYAMGHFMTDTLLGIQPLSVSAKRAAKAAIESYAPLGTAGFDSKSFEGMVAKGLTPTIGLPLVEWMLNENRFGAPIRKDDALFGGAKAPDSTMAFRSVSPISQGIATTLNEITGGNTAKSGAIDINPAGIDFIISSYLPGLLNEGYKFASTGVRVARGEEVKGTPIPLVDRFSAKVPQGYDAGAFRRAKEMTETRYAEFKQFPELRDEIRQELPGLMRAHAIVASTTQEIRKERANYKQIETSQNFSDEEKVARLNRLREREKQLYNRAVKAVMEAGPEFREAIMASD